MNSTFAGNAFDALMIALMKVRGIKCSLNGKEFLAEIIDDIWSAMERKNLLHQHLTQKLTKTRPKDMVLLGMKAI